jgi:hypothetical protein
LRIQVISPPGYGAADEWHEMSESQTDQEPNANQLADRTRLTTANLFDHDKHGHRKLSIARHQSFDHRRFRVERF